jgi:hypothetical protein
MATRLNSSSPGQQPKNTDVKLKDHQLAIASGRETGERYRVTSRRGGQTTQIKKRIHAGSGKGT